MSARRRVAVDFAGSELIVHLLKRHELAGGETDLSRDLISQFRAARDVLATGQPEDTDEIAGEIFAAGAGEGGEPSYVTFRREGVSYTRFRDGATFRADPWQQVS